MNIGIRAARGKWIVGLGAHAEYPPNYFKLCVETSQRTCADNVGGLLITVSPNQSIQGKLIQALTTHPFGVGNAGFRIGAREGSTDTVPYGCYRQNVFERIGLYDERLKRNQDYEFNRRLLRAGGTIWCNPAIQVQYYNQGTLKGLLRQAFATGQWNPWMWFVAPHSFAWRHVIPMGYVATLLIALLLALIAPSLSVLSFKIILAPYFCFAVGASLQQSRRRGVWMFPCLPFLFWTYHLAYGLGGLWGLGQLGMKRAPVQRIPEPSRAQGATAFTP
jgi:hypothetical protein